jgi:hypothetical protein
MKHITLKLTVEELTLLASLASDQLFRREFIDPRMPGYKSNPEEVGIGKALVARMRLMIEPANPNRMPVPTMAVAGGAANGPVRRPNRIPDAL